MALHVLRERLRVGKHIEADLAGLLRVPPGDGGLFLDVQVAERVTSQLAVVGKDFRAGDARVSLVASVHLQMLKDLDRVLCLERTNGTLQQVHVNVMHFPQMHAAVSPALLLLPAVTAFEFTHVRVGRVAFQVKVPALWSLKLVNASFDGAAVDGLLQELRFQVGQREIQKLRMINCGGGGRGRCGRILELLFEFVVLHHVLLDCLDGGKGREA